MKGLLIGLAFIFVSVINADDNTFYFRADRCNTNLDNPENWIGRTPTFTDEDEQRGETPVRAAHLGPTDDEENETWKPVSAHIPAGSMGVHKLTLSNTGLLSFARDGVSIKLYEEGETADEESSFVAGQTYRQECDATCHLNWMTSEPNAVPERIATRPLCTFDTAVVPDDYDVSIYATSFLNLFSFRWGINGDDITSTYDLPQYQVWPPAHYAPIEFKSTTKCQNDGIYDRTEGCLCFSTCDGDNHLDNAAVIRKAAYEVSVLDYSDITGFRSQQFQFTFKYRDILDFMFNSQADSTFDCLFEGSLEHGTYEFDPRKVNDDRILTPFFEALEARFPEVDVVFTDVQHDRRFNYLYIEGVVKAPQNFFGEPMPDGSVRFTWEEIREYSSPLGASTPFETLFLEVIRDQGVACQRDLCTADVKSFMRRCDNSHDAICSDVQLLSEFIQPDKLENNLYQLIDVFDDIPSSPDFNRRRDTPTNEPTDEPTTEEPEVLPTQAPTTEEEINLVISHEGASIDLATLDFIESITRDQLIDIRDILQSTLERVPTFIDDKLDFMRDVEFFVDDQIACQTYFANSEDMPIHDEQTYSFPGVYAGTRLPQADVNHIASPNNDQFREFLAEKLELVRPFNKVFADSVKVVLRDPHTNRNVRSAEFTTTGQAQIPLFITFDYTIITDDCENQEITSDMLCPVHQDDELLEFVRLTIEDIVAVYPIVTDECFDLETGHDMNCVRTTTADAVKACIDSDPNWTRDSLINSCGIPAYVDAFGCGDFGAHPDGSCHDPEASAEGSTLASTEVEGLVDDVLEDMFGNEIPNNGDDDDETGGGGNTAGSSGGSIGIIAGAAAAGVVIVIVVIVLVVVFAGGSRRQDTANPEKDRNIVAFENPMYDDPTGGTGETSAFTNPAEDEGLYDEPANNQQTKENPLYTSTEDLTYDEFAPDDEDEGGYLDVAEGGYLDVAPDPEDEDQ